MAEERKLPAWGATWLLPKEWSAAWGARAIADKQYKRGKWTGDHVASLLPDRQGSSGELDRLREWINTKILPITINYDGSSSKVTEVNDGNFHARWTPNASYGYLYIVAWEDRGGGK